MSYFGSIISVVGSSTLEIIGLFSSRQKVPYDLSRKVTKSPIRKYHMEQLYHTTQLIGIKDNNMTLDKDFKGETHIEV